MERGETRVRRGARAIPEPGWWAYLGPVGVSKVLLLVGLMVWMYWGHLYRLFKYWQQPDWSHGFLIPLFCLYIVNAKRRQLLTDDHQGSFWGLVIMVMSMAVYALSIYTRFGYPQPLSIISMVVGVVLLLRGWRALWLSLFPIGFLILAIPPPERLYRAITQPLQLGAAAIATVVLNALPGADVERGGINIAYFMEDGRSNTFTVTGACSGMRSLMAFVALGLAMAYFTPRPPWHRIAIAIAVVPVALFCNILRVLITGSCQMYGYENLATGTAHTILGFLMFGLGFLIYLGILWTLDHLFVESPEEGASLVVGGES
jgi:exosortase